MKGISEMVERCVDALWEEFCPAIPRTPDDTEQYRRGVIAVIEAMRSAPDDVLKALAQAAWYSGSGVRIEDVWNAAITAALSTGEGL